MSDTKKYRYLIYLYSESIEKELTSVLIKKPTKENIKKVIKTWDFFDDSLLKIVDGNHNQFGSFKYEEFINEISTYILGIYSEHLNDKYTIYDDLITLIDIDGVYYSVGITQYEIL